MIYPKEIISLFKQLKQQKTEVKNIEAKRCKDGVSDSVMQTVCAFANESGIEFGYLLLGISEPDKEHSSHWVSGVNNPDEVLDQIQTNCRNQFNVVVEIDAGLTVIEEKTVIAIKVCELDPAAKPCGFKSAGKNKKNFSKTGIWRRGINGDYEATIEELRPIFSEKQGLSFENTFLPNASWKDIDVEKIELYRKERAKINPNAAELEFDDVALLDAFNLIREKDGVIQPNVAGLLLFGSNAALRKHLPMARVDYIRHLGTKWADDDTQRFLYTKDFRESLISVVPRLEAMILDDMPEYFNLEENALQRTDKPFLPKQVVREAVVNMLMHRDYAQNQPSQINRFSNRLELHNAGYSLKNIEDLGSPKSITRNPLIAAVLYDLRYAETKGSGVKTMRKKLKEANLNPPMFYSSQPENEFRTVLLLQHLMREEQLNWLKLFSQDRLSDNESFALVLAKETGYIDNAGLREILGLDTLSVSKLLKRLCNKNLLVMLGKGQHTYYVLSDIVKERELAEGFNGTAKDVADTVSGTASVTAKDIVDAVSGTANVTAEYVISQNGTQIPNKFRQLTRKRNVAVQEYILAICKDDYCSSSELSELLNINSRSVKRNISELIKAQKLLMRFEDSPTHPLQAYKTK